MAGVNLACKPTQVVTFNMHGFNQGAAFLLELGLSADVFFCQEHWLLTSQLYELDDMLDDLHCISVSAMDDNCRKGVLRGRPCGGLAMFIRSSMCNNMDCIVKSDRVLAVKVHNCIFYLCIFSSLSVISRIRE